MFTRLTSIEAYNYLKENDLIGKRQLEVYQILAENSDKALTSTEIFNILKTRVSREFCFDSNSHARLTELREMGLVEEDCVRQCSKTGRNVIAWKITGNIHPKKKNKTLDYYYLEYDKLSKKIYELQKKKDAINLIINEMNNRQENLFDKK